MHGQERSSWLDEIFLRQVSCSNWAAGLTRGFKFQESTMSQIAAARTWTTVCCWWATALREKMWTARSTGSSRTGQSGFHSCSVLGLQVCKIHSTRVVSLLPFNADEFHFQLVLKLLNVTDFSAWCKTLCWHESRSNVNRTVSGPLYHRLCITKEPKPVTSWLLFSYLSAAGVRSGETKATSTWPKTDRTTVVLRPQPATLWCEAGSTS